MRDKLKQHIDLLFASAPQTEAMRELREELLQNLTDKYDDLIAQGVGEQEAYEQAISGIGDISGLIGGERSAAAPAVRPILTHKQRKSWITAIAVALYVLCLVPLFVAGSVGVVLMFALIAAATALLILNRTNVHPVRASLLAAGVALFIMSPMANVIFGNVLGVIMMFVMIGVGVGLVVYGKSEQFDRTADACEAAQGTAEADAREAGEKRTRTIAIAAILAGLLILAALTAVLDHNRNVTVYGLSGDVIAGSADSPTSIVITDGDEQMTVEQFEGHLESKLEDQFEGKTGDHDDDRQDGEGAKSEKSGKSEKTGKDSAAVAASAGGFSAALADVREIEIDWIGGSVELSTYDGTDIAVTETSAKQLTDAQKLRYWIKNGTLHISYCEDTLSTWNWLDIGAFHMPEKTLTVQLPDGAETQIGEIEVNAVSAEVSATDFAANKLDVTAISGSVTLANVTADKLDVETTSGNVDMQVVSANKLDVETVSGEVSATDAWTKSLEFSCTSGNGEFRLSEAPEKIDSETVSGDCVVLLPADATNFAVRFETVGGNMRCDFASVMQNGLYVVGSGACAYEFESVGGDAEIRAY